MNRKWQFIFIFLFLFSLILFLHRDYLNEFPRFVHAWSQSDRYALSLGFLENGFDLLHPKTFNLGTDGEFTTKGNSGIVSVDPPLPEFVVAVLMKITGTTEPWVFRIYTIIVSALGLAFFVQLLRDRMVAIPLIAGLVGFILLSPVYFYYSSGFIPTISSLSLVMAGIYFYFSPKQNDKKWIGYLLFTLAVLIRMPFLFALLSLGFVDFIDRRKWKPIFISLFVIGLFWLWNKYLYNEYGSLFLRKLMHAENLEDVKFYFNEVWKNWRFHYFTQWHYYFILILLIASAIPALRKKSAFQQSVIFPLIWLLFSFVYYFLMQAQFCAHDYYFLDSFFMPLVLLMILILERIKIESRKSWIIASVLVAGFISTASISNSETQKVRRSTGDWDRTDITYKNFLGGSELLDKLGVDKSKKVLVIDAYSFNAPLILLQRNGYTVLNTTKETITEALEKPFDFVVIQDDYLLSDIVRLYPEITGRLKKIGGNGRISVFVKDESSQNSFHTFFGLTEKNKAGEQIIDTCLIRNEFSCTVDIPVAFLNTDKAHYLLFETDAVINKTIKELHVIADVVSSNGEHLHYRTFNFSEYQNENIMDQKFRFMFSLPQINGSAFKVYVFDPEKDDQIDFYNMRISWYN